MNKVIVIGAGPAGIMAALKASEHSSVILIDKNDRIGRKLLLTGNGKCNYWNEDININNYYTDNYDKLESIISNKDEVFKYITSLGIYPKVKNGYYYPASGESASVKEIFERSLKNSDVEVKLDYCVSSINYKNNKYIINGELECDKLIIASGGMACPKTGSDGMMYSLLDDYNFKKNEILPALTSLNIEGNPLKDASGVRCDVDLSLLIDRTMSSKESGELQITDYGISGICVFNLSSLVSKSKLLGKRVDIKINFVPFIIDLHTFFNSRKEFTIRESLESVISYKLINIILKKSKIGDNDYYEELSDSRKASLFSNLCEFDVCIESVNDFDKSQVSTGGISMDEVNENTMETCNKGLFLVGEILDTDGKCGGFNLAFAFITGYLAGVDSND